MKGKQEFSTFARMFNRRFDNENDGYLSNLAQVKEHPPPRLTKNFTSVDDEKMLEDPVLLSLCIRNLEN